MASTQTTPKLAPSSARNWSDLPLVSAAVLIFAWALYRAVTQAVTLDEADTYYWFASREFRYVWFPFPNNHILNSLLAWISVRLFGPAELSLRLPALAGAAVYLTAVFFLVRQITPRGLLRILLFLCLTLNPFLADYYACARGYSLGLGFLLAALAMPMAPGSLIRRCAFASAALGLTFSANFPMAPAAAAVFVMIALWAAATRRSESSWRLAAALLLPGAAIAAILCGYALLHWPGKEMWYGAHSLAESAASLVEVSLFQLDPALAGTPLYLFLGQAMPIAMAVALAATLLLALAAAADALRSRGRLPARQWFALGIAAVLLATIGAHWVLHVAAGILLPLSRTGMALLPLATLACGAFAAAPARLPGGLLLRGAVATVLLAVAAYDLSCLRTGYFREYEWNGEIATVFSELERLHRARPRPRILANGLYLSPLQFRRLTHPAAGLPEPDRLPDDPAANPSADAYILRLPFHQPLVDRLGLRIVFAGHSTDVAIAVPPNR